MQICLGEKISEGVQVGTFESTFNTCLITEFANFEHGMRSLQALTHFLEMHSPLVDQRGHSPMFRSAVQAKNWYKL